MHRGLGRPDNNDDLGTETGSHIGSHGCEGTLAKGSNKTHDTDGDKEEEGDVPIIVDGAA